MADTTERLPTVTEAVDANDDIGGLEATRRVIAGAIDDPDTPARDLAALTKRFADVSREIRELRAATEGAGSGIDGANAAEEPFDPASV